MCSPDNRLVTRDPAEATVSLAINGKACAAFPNETILSCARRHDLYVPTLCELDDIDHIPGTCRVCVVEILQTGQGAAEIVTACNTPVREGMDVQTRSKKARDMQRLQVELLMADHLQDCATCIRHGNCELQDLAQYVGLKENRFFDRALTESRPIDLSSPAMVRDMQRCVRCQRCVAICRHHQGVDALVMEGNGIDRVVALRSAGSYPESTCVSCGQCVLVCPTGALGERDETDRALDFICDPDTTTVVQFAPAVRVAFGEEFGMPAGTNVEGQIIAACRKIGIDVVLDTNFGADVVIMEEGTELLGRLKDRSKPTFTSCCPAWINFAEIHYPEILPLLFRPVRRSRYFPRLPRPGFPGKWRLRPKT
ncbi:MAG: [Fe-Fe] hydrogenase large subunit C-terminal domain-containing protein [Xanthomonadales bacterium]|jgi:ferredoxin hydrogenase gamma subunit|nr:[Fe-Fe] hydrogenase large subunit C-terminal domain-containing protein [Xanthomonadales bacterium]